MLLAIDAGNTNVVFALVAEGGEIRARWRIATDPRLFTYLRDCRATVGVVLGDARLRLAGAPDHEFDLIVLDAFSSDAIRCTEAPR